MVILKNTKPKKLSPKKPFISETILIAICSLLQNRRFCLIFETGGFVSFLKSAVLSRLQN